jgi:hypothetical protein
MLALKEGGDVTDTCLFVSFRVILCLSPLSLRMIRWLVTDHSVHNEELKTSCDHEIR